MIKVGKINLPVMLVIVAVIAVLFILVALLIPNSLSISRFASNNLEVMDGDFGALYSVATPQQGQQPSAAPQEAPSTVGGESIANEPNAPMDGRVILRTATLRIVVSDTQAALREITGLTAEFGGWVVSSNISRVNTPSGEEAIRGSITVRVTAERLDEALDQIKASAISVESENVTGQDVTQQYVDLTSRLNNLQAAETQLQGILEDARRTEDVLTVYNELVRVRGEIESIQGQIQYYSESAAFSSVNVELVPEALEIPIQIAGWSPEGTARGAFLALLNVLRFLVDVAITVVVLVVPVILIFGVPGWLVYRRVRRRRQAAIS